MPEEKSDWVIGESDPFVKTPIERWDAHIRAIKLSRQLEEEGRSATSEEQRDLVKYSGLGDSAFEQAFSYYGARDPAWQKRRAELEELVSDEQLDGIRRSCINAFHTMPEIVQAMRKGLSDMGEDKLDSLIVLQPSVGPGRLPGLQPHHTAMKSESTEVELDPMTADILKHLYPETKVYAAGFQEAPIPDNHFDIAISNVPFGKVKVYDPKFNESSCKFLTGPVHDYNVDNPDRVLGKHGAAGSAMYRGREYTLKNDPSIPVVPTLNREMREMAKDLGSDTLCPQRTVRYEWPEDFSKAQRKRQTESLVLEDGQLRLSDWTSSRKPERSAEEIQRTTALKRLRDTARKQVTMEAEDADNDEVERTREALRQQYDNYVAYQNGEAINTSTNRKLLVAGADGSLDDKSFNVTNRSTRRGDDNV